MIHHINEINNKNHVIISIDAERSFKKMQHPFMKKTLKMDIERKYLNKIQASHGKLSANITHNDENIKAFL